MSHAWVNDVPALGPLEADARHILEREAKPAALPAGAKVFAVGGPCRNFVIVTRGVVRVQQIAESGREIVLYRVAPGETCVLTTACLLAREDYAAEAIAETPVEAVLLPRATFDRLLAFTGFRDFVFSSYGSRLTDLMLLVEEIAFGQIDARLAQRLLARMNGAGHVALTHQELAVELGTAREVISRQLKEFERRGWVRLERGSVAVLDDSRLRDIAEPG